MRQGVLLLVMLLIATAQPLAHAQTELTPISLTLTLYSNGITQVDYSLRSDPTKVRVQTPLFGENVDNLVVRDEDGNPLQVNLINSTAKVDSIGAMELHFSYQTEDLTSVEDAIWVVNITSPVNVTIILPENADFLDMSNIPEDIGEVGDSAYLVFSSGTNFVYYMLGLPSLVNEADLSYAKAAVYIAEKQQEGYILTAAVELLNNSRTNYDSGNYLEAKEAADDALLIAGDLVGYADDALFAIASAEASINEAIQQERTIGLEEAQSTLEEAQNQYEAGLYPNAEITALQAAEEASLTEKPRQENYLIIGLAIVLLILILWFKRSSFGF
ncbi:MAG: hypothetical protein NWF07_15090 [Candidatus Bathyarchaeota archaeon]|nr:hypothetical protein [Candidatus Bathyarchaeota archaeon]